MLKFEEKSFRHRGLEGRQPNMQEELGAIEGKSDCSESWPNYEPMAMGLVFGASVGLLGPLAAIGKGPKRQCEKDRVATLHGRLPTSPGSLAHNRLSHSSGTVRNLSFKPPNTSENFKRCTSCSQTLAPFSHTSQTNWP